MLEKETLKKLTEAKLQKKHTNLKTIHKILIALAICILVFYCFQIGYAIGKDAASGILDMPKNTTFFLSLIATIIVIFSVEKEIKLLEQEIKERDENQ